ncbi:hypothetical protein BHM03_00051741 [Ensete ventricosum]|nr:hypothetical protein BHM03_00051741 [Ensete ventricosum]
MGATLQATVLVSHARGRLLPLRTVACRLLSLRAAAALAGDRLRASNRLLAGSLDRSRLPLQPTWPWPATYTRGLVVAGHPSSLRSQQKCNKNV